MTVFVEVFGTFGLTVSESKTEAMCMPDSTYNGNEDRLQRHGATIPPDNLLRPFGRHRD